MRKLLFVLMLLSSGVAFAQRTKEIQIRVGAGFGAYGVVGEWTEKYTGFNTTWRDTSGAVTRDLPIELRYELHPRVNVGLDMKFGSYLYDQTQDNTGKSNRLGVFGLAAEFTIVNRENFRWFTGIGFTGAKLAMYEKHTSTSGGEEFSMKWGGGGFRWNTGIIKYFGDSPIGFFYNIGYDSHNFDLKELTSTNTLPSDFAFSGKLLVKGVDTHIGLVARLRPF
jgi:hypothetical protein